LLFILVVVLGACIFPFYKLLELGFPKNPVWRVGGGGGGGGFFNDVIETPRTTLAPHNWPPLPQLQTLVVM